MRIFDGISGIQTVTAPKNIQVWIDLDIIITIVPNCQFLINWYIHTLKSAVFP